jgi:hypothetical protein
MAKHRPKKEIDALVKAIERQRASGEAAKRQKRVGTGGFPPVQVRT